MFSANEVSKDCFCGYVNCWVTKFLFVFECVGYNCDSGRKVPLHFKNKFQGLQNKLIKISPPLYLCVQIPKSVFAIHINKHYFRLCMIFNYINNFNEINCSIHVFSKYICSHNRMCFVQAELEVHTHIICEGEKSWIQYNQFELSENWQQ